MSADQHAKREGLTLTIASDHGALPVVVSPGPPPEVLLGSNEGVRDLAAERYPPVGHCIYCGSKANLSREHIVPLGLGGTTALPAASCRRCARITSKFELEVLRGSMRSVRVVRAMKSRSKHAGAPLDAELVIRRQGREEKIRLPLDQYPVLLPFPIFPPPRYLAGVSGSGVVISGIHTVLFSGRSPIALAKELGADNIVLQPARDRPASFARMLAKIGYAMAVAERADELLDGPSTVLPAIVGERDDIGDWVGTHTGSVRKYPGMLHRVLLNRDSSRRLLLAEVQLFADSESPCYGVILGKLKA